MLYENLKLVHIGCIILSISGFVLRWIWMLLDSSLLQARISRILPHIIDTALLASAIALVYIVPWNILVNEWLQVKIAALLVYIVLGSIALKRGRTKATRTVSGVLALLVFSYMVSVALTRSAYGVMQWL